MGQCEAERRCWKHSISKIEVKEGEKAAQNIRRLGVFCFYDSEGVVDSYIEYLLQDFKSILSELIVVVNGYVNENDREKLNKYADSLLVRENAGFDFGAYYEVLTQKVDKKMQTYDELILCNDTFYGPFISFKDIIKKMQDKDCDFWGLNLVEDGFLTHIQSYFLVFRKKILHSEILYQFLQSEKIEKLVMTKAITDIYAIFEVGLFRFLVQSGYIYDSYANTKNADIYQSPDICLTDYALPILKRKSFEDWHKREGAIKRAWNYIKQTDSYDIEYIKENVKRKYGIEEIEVNLKEAEKCEVISYGKEYELISENVILDFIEKHAEIYIYGSGVYARKLWFLFGDRIERFRGFVVSDGVYIKQSELYGYPIKHYKDILEGSSIIIGCDYKNTREICGNIKLNDVVCEIWKKG